LSLAKACRFIGISRQAYYQQCKAEAAVHERDRQVVEHVAKIRCRQPRLGARKLHGLIKAPLADQGIQLGRDALFAVLKRAHMLVPPQRAFHKTTHSYHRFYKHPNLVKAGMSKTLTGPEQLWVADITYLPTAEKCVYLSLVTDAYSRKIVGFHVHDSLQAEAVALALKMALSKRQGMGRLIHHSDRGIQYCSAYYQGIHQAHGITCSMTDGYDCYQNALAERINGILKTEFLLCRPKDLQQARQMVHQSIAIYNDERPHLALQYKTPNAVHQASLQKLLN
jgi:transposase InsO family protein